MVTSKQVSSQKTKRLTFPGFLTSMFQGLMTPELLGTRIVEYPKSLDHCVVFVLSAGCVEIDFVALSPWLTTGTATEPE